MTYSFQEYSIREFVLRVRNESVDSLSIPNIIEDMKKEMQKAIINYVNAKVMVK